MKKLIEILLVAVAAVSLFVACAPEAKYYTVTFDVDGNTTTVAAQSVQEGGKAEKPASPVKTGYYLSAWNTADGKKFDFNKDVVTADIILTAIWKDAYNIGDIGPAGGWIFYDVDADNASGDADKLNSYDAGWRYIEAAPDDWNNGTSTGDAQFTWGPVSTTISSGTETGVGKGKENTANIMAQAIAENKEFPAAKLCYTYSVSKGTTTYSGWFLPSRDELEALYTNLVKSDSATRKGTWITSAVVSGYWSSSTSDINSAYVIYFSGEEETQMLRDTSKYVRPVHYV